MTIEHRVLMFEKEEDQPDPSAGVSHTSCLTGPFVDDVLLEKGEKSLGIVPAATGAKTA